MSILIKTRRASDFNLSEREWLRRIRGTTLANLADAANQIAYRRGFVTVSKSFFYEQERDDKSNGGGNIVHDWDRIQNAGSDSYYVDLIHTHPAADEIGIILTYLAPPDVDTSGTPYTPHVKIRLENSSGTILDPSSGSGYAVELTHANGGIPAGSFIVNEMSFFENDDGTLNLNFAYPPYTARIIRTICYLDQGTNPSTTPRRLKYGTAAGTSQHLIVRIDTQNALMINATVFEIPKITT